MSLSSRPLTSSPLRLHSPASFLPACLSPPCRVRGLLTLVRSLVSRREVRAAPKAQARAAIGPARSFDHLGPYRGAGLASYAA